MNTIEQVRIADSEPNTASPSGVEDSSAPGQSGTADETRKPAARDKGGRHTALKTTKARSLNAAEREELIRYEKDIKNARATGRAAFFRMVEALAWIHESKLYRETHRSFGAYAAEKWGLGRSHANRLASAGKIILRQKLSPRGDIYLLMDNEAHYRSLAMLEPESQDMALDLLGTWRLWDKELQITPRTVKSAIDFLNPPSAANDIGQREIPLIAKVQAAVDEVIKQLPENVDDEIRGYFEQLKKKVTALEDPAATGEGELPDAPWNLLQDCGKNSSSLLPENLVVPLRDRTQRPYVVSSEADLFDDEVPDDFIETVFNTMVKAHWHQFQVLSKRSTRVLAFITNYFAGNELPPNIRLHASAGNQKALDERLYGEDGTKLKKVKKDGLTPPPLEGQIHNAYPQERTTASEGDATPVESGAKRETKNV